MIPSYTLTLSSPWFLNDLDREQYQQLEGHIGAQDYFGTLATVLSLMHQQEEKESTVLPEIVDELTHLQEHYVITKKET